MGENTIYERIFINKETIVVLGNDQSDIEWILQKLPKTKEERNYMVVYNPSQEDEVEESEERLRTFLREGRGCLLTRGELFNGMESATVVLVFDNPYASHFRANFLRASVEIIAIDRNNKGTTTLLMKNFEDKDFDFEIDGKRKQSGHLAEEEKVGAYEEIISQGATGGTETSDQKPATSSHEENTKKEKYDVNAWMKHYKNKKK